MQATAQDRVAARLVNGRRPAGRGRTLVLIGADGAGKSTQARLLCGRLGDASIYVYMGSNPSSFTHALPTTRAWNWLKRKLGGRTHHSGPPDPGLRARPPGAGRRWLQHLKSLGVVALRASEETYRLLLVRRYERQGRLVVMDRHPFADYYTRRVGGAGGWQRLGDRIHGFLLEHVYPRPASVVLLDAPADVLHERKPEGSLAAVRARRQEYLDMIHALDDIDVRILDANRSDEEVLADVIGAIEATGWAPGPGGTSRRAGARVLGLGLLLSLVACDIVEITGEPEAGSDVVRIMTYNVFHDGEDPARGVPPWSERRDRIVDIISERAPHVLGLQEAEVWQVDWLLDRLPEYEAVSRGVDADAGRIDSETVAILYRRGSLRLEESGHFWYSDAPDEPGSLGDATFGGLTRPRMATWVRLRIEDSDVDRTFYVFNTHFPADGTADDPELARERSAELLVRRITERAHPDDFFFVVGDLNTRPGEWPIRYLLGSRCRSGADCDSEPEVRMIDAWTSQSGDAGAGTRCNAVTGGDGPRVDYVLAQGAPPDPAPAVLDAEIVRDGSGCPSDHVPVTARVSLPPSS